MNINQYRLLTIGVLLGLSSGTTTVLANPQGANVVNGQVQFNHPDPNTLAITNSNGAIINWQQFSIQQNEITKFIQPDAASAVLNRVVGGDPSSILGQLLSNGRVFLINPNGIVFGPNSVIDTAGLIASTLDMTNDDFLNQHLKFQGENAADISNKGYIKAGANGDIFLIAPNIENSGIIETDGGKLVLAAGESVTIASLDSDHIVFDVQAPENEVINLGEMITNGGATRMFAGTIKHEGSINANSISVDENGNVLLFAKADIEIATDAVITANGANGGEVKIESDEGTVWNSGKIEATGTEEQGGKVEVLGERVALMNDASIDASGETGGGEVLIGGDYQGKNAAVKNAKQTFVGEDTSIRADAETNGDGGKVIVWADETTQAYGKIFARGGQESGNGGFIETSGKRYLEIGEYSPDASAANGEAGTWLLDPEDIDITAVDANITQLGSGDPGPVSFTPTSIDTVTTINVANINTALNNGSNVVVDTSGGGTTTMGTITVSSAISKTADGGSADGSSLTLNADHDININADITSTVGVLDINLDANRSSGSGEINIGNVTLDTNSGILNTNGDTVNLTNGLILNNTDWTNTGTINWTTAIGSISFNQTITNQGIFNINTSGAANDFIGGGTFDNQGTVNKLSASTGDTEFRASTLFNSSTGSIIDVQGGAGGLFLNAGGTHTGILTFLNQGPTFDNGIHTFNAALIGGNAFTVTIDGASAPTFNGTGLTTVAGITANVDVMTLDTDWINQGTVNFTGAALNQDLTINSGRTFTNQNMFNINNSDANAEITGLGTFDNDGFLTKLSSSTVDTTIGTVFNSGALGATNIQASAGDLILSSSGTHSGGFVIAPGTALQFTGGAHTFNTGSGIIGAGDVVFNGGSIYTFNSGSAYSITGDTTLNGSTSDLVFDIAASTDSFTHTDGILSGLLGGLTVSTTWTPTSNVTVDGNLITPSAPINYTGFTINGSGTISLPGAITISSGTNTFGPSMTFGSLAVTAGTLSLTNNSFVIGTLSLNGSGGVITGNGDLSIAGLTTWSVGAGDQTFSGAGTTFADGGFSITGNPGNTGPDRSFTLDRALEISSASTWSLTSSGGIRGAEVINGGSGSIVNNGTITINTNKSLEIAAPFTNAIGAQINSTGGTDFADFSGAFTNDGAVNAGGSVIQFDGGGSQSVTGSMSVAAGSYLHFASNTFDFNGGSITGAGTFVTSGGTTNINAGTTYNLSGLTSFGSNAGSFPGVFTAGTLNFNTNSTTGTLQFVDSGGVLGGTGDLTVSGTTSWAVGGGSHTIASGGDLNANGGFTLTGNPGNGITRIMNLDRTVNIAGSSSWGLTNSGGLGGATFSNSGSGNIVNTGTITVNTDKRVNISTPFTNNAPGAVNTTGGTNFVSFNDTFDNDGNISIAAGQTIQKSGGTFTWNGGSISGPGSLSFIGGPILNIGGAGTKTLGTGITLASTSLTVGGTGILDINGGSLTVSGATAISSGATLRVTTAGGFNPSGAVNNDGVLDLLAGTLSLGSGGTHSGNFNVASGSVLQYTGGVHTFGSGTTSGAGDVAFTGGTATYNAGSTYTISGDTGINGGGPIFNINAVTGSLTHASGSFGGGSSGTITTSTWTPSNGVTLNDIGLILAANGNNTLTGVTVNTAGAASITNQGTLTLNSSTLNPTLNNTGILLFSGSGNTLPGTFTLSGGAFLVNPGSDISMGSLVVNGGVVDTSGTINAPVTLNSGILAGIGNINGNVINNGGTLAAGLSPGTLSITGNYTQGAGAIFQAELAGTTTAGVDYDLLSVTGTTTLAGTLDIQLFGGFTGAIGDQFDIIQSSGGITGDFTTVTTPTTHTFTNTPNVPAAGNYQLEIGSVSTDAALDSTSSVIVVVSFNEELGKFEFTTVSKDSTSEGDSDDKKKIMACQ